MSALYYIIFNNIHICCVHRAYTFDACDYFVDILIRTFDVYLFICKRTFAPITDIGSIAYNIVRQFEPNASTNLFFGSATNAPHFIANWIIIQIYNHQFCFYVHRRCRRHCFSVIIIFKWTLRDRTSCITTRQGYVLYRYV